MKTENREFSQRLFSPNRAAEMLDISRSTLYSLMKNDRVAFVYIGADRRIPAEEIERIAREGLPKNESDE